MSSMNIIDTDLIMRWAELALCIQKYFCGLYIFKRDPDSHFISVLSNQAGEGS